MFSLRTNWDICLNELSTRLEERRRKNLSIIDLTESNPTRCDFEYPDVLSWLSDPKARVYAPDPKGDFSARQSVSVYYADKGIKADPERIILTASTSEAYTFLFRLLANPGDEILVPCPSYPLFEFLSVLSDVDLVPYTLAYDTFGSGWRIDLASLLKALTPNTRAILIVHPNNPTGSLLHPEDLSRIAAICREHDLAIISDEVFSDYLFPNVHIGKKIEQNSRNEQVVVSLADRCKEVLTFTLSGISKLAGLPQMKLSWIYTSGPDALVAKALHRLEIISDTYLSVNTPVQCALPKLLSSRHIIQNQIASRVISNREYLTKHIAAVDSMECLQADGGWYAVLKSSAFEHEETWVLNLLERQGILTHPGYFFDFEAEGFIVLSLLPKPEIFEAGVSGIVASSGGVP